MRALLFGLSALLACAAPAQAQQSHIENLREMFVPLIGAWPVEVLDYDAAGNIEYQALQLRELRFVAGGRQLRETLLMRDSRGRVIEGGMVLHGLNFDTGEVSTWTFWGQASDGLMGVSRFEGSGEALRLVGEGTTQFEGRPARVHSEFRWENGALVWRTWLRPQGQREHLDHVITYRTSPTEIFPARTD